MGFLHKLVLPALFALAFADFPLDFEEFTKLNSNEVDPTIYRIPEDLDPIHFEVEVTPYFWDEGTKQAFSFDGRVTFSARAVKEGLTSFVVQENVRTIESVTVTTEAGDLVLLDPSTPFERIREYHFLKINLREGVTLVNNQVYLVTIEYIGNINETPLSRGMFRGSYKDGNGNLHWYAATHLQPVNSRQLFPSFDEPGFKSTFTMIVNRPVTFTETFSNMRIANQSTNGDRVREVFHPTPRMPAYLVTLHISEEFKVIADNNDNQRSYRIIARPNADTQGSYALEVGPPITEWLEDYFGIDYYTMGEDMKNDQIAVPDWASGATENWGLVSYRELRLLYEDNETNALDKMYIGTITAHELAHKWFGNLITCRWWDNVWINEGFASYFEYFAMDGVDKSMELEDQFNIMYLQSALSTDSSANTRALQHTVNSPAEVTGHFSDISYSKGASLLLMLKHWLSENTFKKALNYFLVDRSYQYAFPDDLYSAFARAVAEDSNYNYDVNIAEFLRTWVDEPGFPLLKVDYNSASGKVNLEQKRFFVSATATPTNQIWPLPLTYTFGSSWDNLTPQLVLQGRDQELDVESGHDWIIFNVQQKGIYRVTYDVNTWEKIAHELKSNTHNPTIHYLNRAQIVDDVFALMRSEEITFELGFHILEFLKEERSYYVWYPAITGFTFYRNRFLHLPDTLAEYDAFLLDYLDGIVAHVGYDVIDGEPLTDTLKRLFILNFACNVGHEGCISDAIQKYSNLRTSGVSVNPNVRRHVFCHGIREGSYEDWQFMYQRRLAGNNQADGVAMLRALGCSTDERAIEEFMNMVLSDDVKAQDRLNAFTFLFAGDRGNAKAALPFIKTRLNEIRRSVVLQTWFNSFISNLAAYLDEEGLEEMEEWLRQEQATIPEASLGLSAVTSARNNMAWGSERAQRIMSAIRGSATALVPMTMLLLTSSLAMFL